MQEPRRDGWEHFEHMADIGVRGFGATKAEAFAQAACALTAAVADLGSVQALQEVRIACAAGSDDLLLFEWLNALIFEMATRKMLFSRFAVRIDGLRLEASAWGEPIEPERHAPAAEAKGATLTALRVAPCAEGWLAQCVVDV